TMLCSCSTVIFSPNSSISFIDEDSVLYTAFGRQHGSFMSLCGVARKKMQLSDWHPIKLDFVSLFIIKQPVEERVPETPGTAPASFRTGHRSAGKSVDAGSKESPAVSLHMVE
ncbi:MAG: hypothetical protein AB7E30_07860, partial [Lawsonibacter sp.]